MVQRRSIPEIVRCVWIGRSRWEHGGAADRRPPGRSAHLRTRADPVEVLAEERQRRQKVTRRSMTIMAVIFYVPLGVGLGVGLYEHSFGWGLAAFALATVALVVVEVLAATVWGLGLLAAVLRQRHKA